MPLKAGNWQINISPSSKKDSGFWDPWGFGIQEQLSQNTKWQFDSRKIDKLNSRHWISKSWQRHLDDLELLDWKHCVGMDNGLSGLTRADQTLEEPMLVFINILDYWMSMMERAPIIMGLEFPTIQDNSSLECI